MKLCNYRASMEIKDTQKNYTSPFKITLNRDQVLYIINIV